MPSLHWGLPTLMPPVPPLPVPPPVPLAVVPPLPLVVVPPLPLVPPAARRPAVPQGPRRTAGRRPAAAARGRSRLRRSRRCRRSRTRPPGYWNRNPPPPGARRRTCERKKWMSLDVEPFFETRSVLSIGRGKIKERSAGSSPSRRSCRSGTSSGRCRTASARDVTGRAGVGRAAVGGAVGGQRLLADAVVAVPARGHALRDLRAGRALRGITEVLRGARRHQPDRRRRAGHRAAAEAVTAVRDQLLALVDARSATATPTASIRRRAEWRRPGRTGTRRSSSADRT